MNELLLSPDRNAIWASDPHGTLPSFKTPFYSSFLIHNPYLLSQAWKALHYSHLSIIYCGLKWLQQGQWLSPGCFDGFHLSTSISRNETVPLMFSVFVYWVVPLCCSHWLSEMPTMYRWVAKQFEYLNEDLNEDVCRCFNSGALAAKTAQLLPKGAVTHLHLDLFERH